MEIINLTQFSTASFGIKIDPPDYAAVFMVKGSFSLELDRRASALDESDPLTGDVFVDDDPDKSCICESDFAPYKPKADLIFSGKCYSPGRKPVTVCDAVFQVGTFSKTVFVFGNRWWRKNSMGFWSMSEPEPFREMDLIYENSFGGEGFKNNPFGKGIKEVIEEDGAKSWPLPNLEDPENLIASIKDRPMPAGFGPIGRTWPIRMSGKVGTYDDEWLKTRWPWFPVDFDWSYFNCAPQGLQADGYLSGHESIFLKNLHPDYPEFRCQLPCVRPRLFVCEFTEFSKEGPLDEVRLVLDTLWLDMNNDKLHLVWRGARRAKTEKLDELASCFLVSEDLEQDPLPVEHYQQLFLKSRELADEDEAFLNELDKEELFTLDDQWLQEMEADFAIMDKELKKMEAVAAEAEKKAEDLLKEAGIDPVKFKEAEKEAQKLSLKDILIREAQLLKELVRDHPELADKLPPPMSPEEIDELSKDLTPELEETKFEPLPEPLDREACCRRLETGEGFNGEDLTGLDLSGLDFSGTDCSNAVFTGADLTSAVFQEADLSGASFAGCILSGLNFQGARLFQADFSGANLSGSDLAEAVLDDADLSSANLRGARLDKVQAKGTLFVDADLTNAVLKSAMLQEADLEGAILAGADFQGAFMREASVERCAGSDVNMSGADLAGLHAGEGPDFTNGVFRGCMAPGSIWEESILAGADFSGAMLQEANFMSANLSGAVFTGADLAKARLDWADLTNTVMFYVNLFKGCLEGACLMNTDFRGANMYEVEFYQAEMRDVLFRDTNLKMTKLEFMQKHND